MERGPSVKPKDISKSERERTELSDAEKEALQLLQNSPFVEATSITGKRLELEFDRLVSLGLAIERKFDDDSDYEPIDYDDPMWEYTEPGLPEPVYFWKITEAGRNIDLSK